MNNEIKKAISKAMAKLVGFSLNEKAMNGNPVNVNVNGQFGHDIWVTDPSNATWPIDIILSPKTIEDIPAFERVIEKKMAELKVRFHTSAEVMANLDTKVNE